MSHSKEAQQKLECQDSALHYLGFEPSSSGCDLVKSINKYNLTDINRNVCFNYLYSFHKFSSL